MNNLIFLVSLVILSSCGSTTVKKKIELQALDDKHPVKVYTELPPFAYEVVCEIDITRKGDFVATTREAYISNVEVEARKCGANMGLIESLNGFSRGTSADISVKAYAIRQVSEVDKITGEDIIKRLVKAVDLDNLTAVKELTKNVNKDPSKRSTNDTDLLNLIIFENAKKGFECSQKTVSYLVNNFSLKQKKLYFKIDYRSYEPEKMAACSDVFVSSFNTFENREDVLRYMNNFIVGVLNYFTGSAADVKGIQNVNKVMPAMTNEILEACKKDSTSDLCLYKERFAEIKQRVQQLIPKSKPASQTPLKDLFKGIRI